MEGETKPDEKKDHRTRNDDFLVCISHIDGCTFDICKVCNKRFPNTIYPFFVIQVTYQI